MDSFEYNYPYKNDIISQCYQWRDNLSYLKKEMLDNLISLNNDEKGGYLNKLDFEVREIRTRAWSSLDDLEKWKSKYDALEYDVFNHGFFLDSELHQILSNEPVKFKETFLEEYNNDSENIQFDFYNYHYGFFLDQGLEFIESVRVNNQQKNNAKDESKKLRTKLSVPQLTYFFKALVAEGFFESKTQKEIYDFISANFSSKGSEAISANSIKNNYEQPKFEDVDFLHKKFINLSQTAKKDKENL